MITKYDMSSGALIFSSQEEDTATSITLIEPTTSLRLALVATEPEPERFTMPADLALRSIQEFLKQQ